MLPRWIQLPPLVPLLLVPLLVSACGDSSDGSQDSKAGTTAVKVAQVFEPQMPYGEEGALSFALIEGDGGTVAQADGIQPRITGVTPLLSEQLANGSYRVSSYQRTCGPSSCDQEPGLSSLDPPSVQCSADFEVREQEPVNVVVTVQPVRGACTIRVGSRGDSTPSEQPNNEQADANLLWGRTFASSSVTERDEPRQLVDGKPVTLSFERSPERESIAWGASCNGFGARVEIKAEKLLVGGIGQTLIGCPGESAEQDEWLSEFFAGNPRWEMSDARLTIQSGATVIEFEQTNR